MWPKNILPPDLEASAYIAGGYAACPALASDLDLWVYVQPERDTLANVRQRVLDWLENEMWPYEAEENTHKMIGEDANGYSLASMKVSTVRSPHWSHPVHIMVTTAQPRDLIETFDISTHQIAIVFGQVIKGSGWTPIIEPPVVLKMTSTTPERLEKIRKRFGFSQWPHA